MHTYSIFNPLTFQKKKEKKGKKCKNLVGECTVCLKGLKKSNQNFCSGADPTKEFNNFLAGFIIKHLRRTFSRANYAFAKALLRLRVKMYFGCWFSVLSGKKKTIVKT